MRGSVPPVASLVLLAALLAGCSGGGGTDEPTAGDFDDLGLKATSTTGVLLGVVVDGAIRPVPDVDITVTKPDGGELKDVTDEAGRFAFEGLPPGGYIIKTQHPQFTPQQASTVVEAGVAEPPVVRILIERLFSQDPFSELIKFDGFLACAYAIGASSTCANDYTRLVQCVPTTQVCPCPGGCLRDQNVSSQGGNVREYVVPIGPGWQILVFEAVWEPALAGTSEELGAVVSYYGRVGAQHNFASESQANPMRFEIEVEETAALAEDGQPENIPPEGIVDLFVFFSAGSGGVAVNQPFRSFQSNFYYGLPPEGWSFVESGEVPF